MTTRDEWLDLAERCETAEGPDRELDAALVKALAPNAIIDIYIVGDDEPTVFHAEPYVQNKTELPRFTSSIDAIAALVERSFRSRWEIGKSPQIVSAVIEMPPNFKESGFHMKGSAPLALCAAYCRAKAEGTTG